MSQANAVLEKFKRKVAGQSLASFMILHNHSPEIVLHGRVRGRDDDLQPTRSHIRHLHTL